MIFSTRIVSWLLERQDNRRNINIPPNSGILFFVSIISISIFKLTVHHQFGKVTSIHKMFRMKCYPPIICHPSQTSSTKTISWIYPKCFIKLLVNYSFRVSTNFQMKWRIFCITIHSYSLIKIFRTLRYIVHFQN